MIAGAGVKGAASPLREPAEQAEALLVSTRCAGRSVAVGGCRPGPAPRRLPSILFFLSGCGAGTEHDPRQLDLPLGDLLPFGQGCAADRTERSEGGRRRSRSQDQ